MALNKDALEAVASQHSTELATKAISGATTAKLLIDNKSVQAGVKGSAAISKLDSDVTFQDNTGCARNPLGDTKLSNKRIYVSPIKDEQNICVKTLYDTYFAEMIGKGQSPEGEDLDASFVKSIIDFRTSKIAYAVEQLIWQGDTSGTGNLARIDGLLKQATAASDKVSITVTGSDYVAKLQSVYKAMPIAVRKSEDFRIFLGEDMYDNYLADLAAKNIFKPVEDLKLFGTSATLQPTSGLNDTNKVFAAKISDLQLGMDGTDDADKVEFRFSNETNQWYMDVHFAVGVSVVYSDQIGLVSFNVAPTVDAGEDQSITATSATLTAVGTDGDGHIVSYAWTKTSGTGGTITTPDAASTTVTGLTTGTYVFKVTVTDNSGATAEDSITVVKTA